MSQRHTTPHFFVGKTGSISIQQRFGSALNLNLHYHVIFLDGVYVRGADGRLSFRRVTPHTADVERLVVEIADACEAWLAEQGCGAEDAIEPGEDDAQAVLQQAALLGQATLGERAGRRARRVQRADTDFKGGWPSTACRGDPLAMGSGGVSSGSRRLDGSSGHRGGGGKPLDRMEEKAWPRRIRRTSPSPGRVWADDHGSL